MSEGVFEAGKGNFLMPQMPKKRGGGGNEESDCNDNKGFYQRHE